MSWQMLAAQSHCFILFQQGYKMQRLVTYYKYLQYNICTNIYIYIILYTYCYKVQAQALLPGSGALLRATRPGDHQHDC